jgi:hypothetical protein
MGANAGKFLLTRKSALLADMLNDSDRQFACEDEGCTCIWKGRRDVTSNVRSGAMVYPEIVFLVCFIRDLVTIKKRQFGHME